MSRLLKSPLAESDLVSIGRFIAEDNPQAADALLDAFEEKFHLLVEQPEIGKQRAELAPGLRSFPVGKYLIFYTPLPDGIVVIRVLHGARDLRRIFRRRRPTL
ncbi:MAG TPA: type II toxin-antitoxin system RelE/ParE family toxin [Tepidisphaeraceae bacterium]|jgi:toxin ParE1/3/4|nr:type II toxin-antitoxin system RelE/ParE family toxin [Tepidisphaeraceae bacterium]